MTEIRIPVRPALWFAAIALVMIALVACGGGTDSETAAPSPTITISPATVSLPVGGGLTFSAVVSGASDQALVWSAEGGTITQSGEYTATTPGNNYKVTATLAADAAVFDEAFVTVTAAPVVSVSIKPANPTITVGTTQLFNAVVVGGLTADVTWSIESTDPDPGTITEDGLYTAPNHAGTFTVAARTKADPPTTARATVTVVTQPVPRVTIVDTTTPANAPPKPVVNGEVRLFQAVLENVSQVDVSWTVTAVDPTDPRPWPTVTPSGDYTLFTASDRPGGYNLHATVKSRVTELTVMEADYLVEVLLVGVCVYDGSPPLLGNGSPAPCDSATWATRNITLSAGDAVTFGVTVTTDNGAGNVKTYTDPSPVVPMSWTWAVVEGARGGEIVPGTGAEAGKGKYRAPVLGGTFHVTARVDQYPLKSGSATVVVNPINVDIDPASETVRSGDQLVLTATVTHAANATDPATQRNYREVEWKIQEGAAGGALLPASATFDPVTGVSTAVYTAPSGVGGRVYHVIATSVSDPAARAVATLSIQGIWVSAAGGGHHGLAVKSDGTLWAWGNNYSGQVGDGTTISRSSPVRIGNSTTWSGVAAGADHSLALNRDGTGLSLYAWGANASGQLGDGTFTARNAPVQIGPPRAWLMVSARGNHAVGIQTNGSLWAWGDNTFGQIGNGNTVSQPVPTQIVVTDSNGVPLQWATAAAGTDHTLAIATDGSLWAWGRNDAGQLGLDDTAAHPLPARVGIDNDWLAIDGGALHSAGVRRSAAGSSNGSLWVWGDNSANQLGQLAGAGSLVPIQVGTDTNWTRVFAGERHTVATKADQTLWGWGDNAHGELGLAQSPSGTEPTPRQLGGTQQTGWVLADAGLFHSVMLTADGRLFSTGRNFSGELGNGKTASKSSPVLAGGTSTGWSARVAAGSAHNAAIKADGSLWTWGSNTHGQLGDGTRVDRDRPVRIGAGGWVHVAAGAVHSAAIDAEGRLYTWGDNSKGQLGVGVAVAASSTPVEIPQYAVSNRWVGLAAGDFHTVAVTQDGDMWAWGSNEFGQVGNNGAAAIEPLPVLIGGHTCAAFGGVCRKWVVVAAAGDHTLAILYDFDGVALTYPLWAWGRNDVGQVGDGTLDDKPSPVKIRADMGWVSVSAGRTHSFAMTGVGGTELWVWGDNSWGQLGIGSAVPWVQEPVRFDAALWRSVSGGGAHSAAIMPDGTLWAWGLNSSGQLGTGVDLNRNTPGQVGTAATWAAVSAGFSHTVAVHSNGTLWAWGLNDAGQLGDDAAWVEALVEIP